MVYSEMLKKVADKSKMSQKKVQEVHRATIEAIVEAIKKGEDVTFAGLGKFYLRKSKSKTVTLLGKKVKTKDWNLMKFKNSIKIKRELNK